MSFQKSSIKKLVALQSPTAKNVQLVVTVSSMPPSANARHAPLASTMSTRAPPSPSAQTAKWEKMRPTTQLSVLIAWQGRWGVLA